MPEDGSEGRSRRENERRDTGAGRSLTCLLHTETGCTLEAAKTTSAVPWAPAAGESERTGWERKRKRGKGMRESQKASVDRVNDVAEGPQAPDTAKHGRPDAEMQRREES